MFLFVLNLENRDGTASITGAAGNNPGGGQGPLEGVVRINSVTDGGLILLEVSGPSGSTFEMDYSADLMSWTSVTTVTLTNTSLVVADTANIGNRSGYYRLRKP